MNDDDIDQLARGLDIARPPPGFADRVMEARAADGAHADSVHTDRRRARTGFAMVASALAGAAACLAVVALVSAPAPAGALVSLHTPAGTLAGVSFTADVNPLNPLSPQEPAMFASPSQSPKTLATAALGAIAGAALTVAVSAGELTLTNDAGSVKVKPGEVATVVAGAVPTKAPGMTQAERELQLRTENEGLRAALEAARAGGSGDVTRLVTENQTLRDKLKRADEEVALLDDLRKAQEGVPHGFPDDLPPRFAEANLQKAFEDAMNEAGIEGGVIEIDCKEYPCLVLGQLSSKHDMDKLRDAAAFAPYQDDSDNTSLWHTKKDKDGKKTEVAYFGVALAPKAPQPGGDDELNKRVHWRMQQAADALFPRDQR